MNTIQTPTPIKIGKQDPSSLTIEWSNNEKFALEYAEVRFNCPCAACVDELTGRRTLKRETVDPLIRPLKIDQVGNYAVTVLWSDNHKTGIYSYDTLYNICQQKGHAPSERTL
jgi:DUF971 family protein